MVELRVTKKKSIPPPPCLITLLQALPKGKIIEGIIQKSVELGAHRVVPLLTEHVVARLDDESAEHKREKWQQVAIEAIKQCGAAWLPKIDAPTTIEQFLAPHVAAVGNRCDLLKVMRNASSLPKAATPTHLNSHSLARSKPSAAIRANVSVNFKQNMGGCRRVLASGLDRKAISRSTN